MPKSMIHVLLVVILPFITNGKIYASTTDCSKSAKAETYLDTAVSLIEKLKDNLPENDCSCPLKPVDCSEVLSCGFNVSGIYKVWPRNRIMQGSIDVLCDMTSEGGGWTVLLKRADYKRPQDFFFKNWHKYKTGFGDLRKDFWLGNDNIYALTNQDKYHLLIEFTDRSNDSRYAFYDQFWIDNEEQYYKLHIYDYSGDAGDELASSNGHKFSTHDKNNAINSTRQCGGHKGGWWHVKCLSSNLNGMYGVENAATFDEFAWNERPLRNAEMKIRPASFRMHYLDMQVDIE